MPLLRWLFNAFVFIDVKSERKDVMQIAIRRAIIKISKNFMTAP
jgi:hypothetical protein